MEYEYHIEHLDIHTRREGISLNEDYEGIIANFSNDGWRFVQLVNFSELCPNERRMDLIFERIKKRK